MEYRELPEFNIKEINRIMQSGTIEELILLPLSLGEYYYDWKTAQDICVRLADHYDETVRGSAALGLSYIARTKGRLEKHRVKPVLLKLLRECEKEKGRVIDSIEDINLYMKWRIAEKVIGKLEP